MTRSSFLALDCGHCVDDVALQVDCGAQHTCAGLSLPATGYTTLLGRCVQTQFLFVSQNMSCKLRLPAPSWKAHPRFVGIHPCEHDFFLACFIPFGLLGSWPASMSSGRNSFFTTMLCEFLGTWHIHIDNSRQVFWGLSLAHYTSTSEQWILAAYQILHQYAALLIVSHGIHCTAGPARAACSALYTCWKAAR
jgi:hypothetical protein